MPCSSRPSLQLEVSIYTIETVDTPKMDPPPLSTRAPEQFVLFHELPTEIQLLIWKLAVPDPRSLHGAITFILNLDLSKPFAILPSIQDMRKAFYSPFATHRYRQNGRDEQYNVLQEGLNRSIPIWRAVLSLLHTCRVSREIVLQTYRVDLDSIIEAENTPLWTPEDIVYFPWDRAVNIATLEALVNWFFQKREKPRPSLMSLQHAAFLFLREVARPLNLEPWDEIHEYVWAKNFPSLQSFSLFLDPCKVCYYCYRGKVLLYEPEEVSVEDVYNLTPAQIVHRIAEGLRQPGVKEADLLLVETFVVQVRKSKRCKK
jgi:hypothetical protein